MILMIHAEVCSSRFSVFSNEVREEEVDFYESSSKNMGLLFLNKILGII